MTNLETFQRTVANALTVLALVQAPVLMLICWLLGHDLWSYGLAAFGFAIVPSVMLLLGRSTTAVAFALAVTLVAQTSLLVAAFNGHPWQVEMHFYYFAVLAMLSGFCDWRVLLLAAGLIAIHHLGLNELLPAAVYPGGNNIYRVVVHAIVVVIETSMLVLIGRTIRGAFAMADEARHAAEATAAQLETLAAHQKDDLVATTTRADRMGGMLDRFKREMAETVEVLHAAAVTLETNAGDLSAATAQSSAQSISATSMTQDTAAKVNLAAQAGEELARTITQVGDNAAQSSRLAAAAVSEAERTTSTINDMASVASEIGNVTDLISAIAAQTNLLALNATIEAARAGESGRGFAVVAQEVKALAAQTAKATNDIASRIEAMQGATTRSVGAIGGISSTIQELDQFSSRIAQAVEEQVGAAREIAGNVNAAASAAVRVNHTIGEVGTIAQKMTQAVGRVGATAAQIAEQTHKIRERVRVFTDDIVALRAAEG